MLEYLVQILIIRDGSIVLGIVQQHGNISGSQTVVNLKFIIFVRMDVLVHLHWDLQTFVACQCRMDRVVSCQALICCEAKWKLCRFETKLGRLYLGVENCAYGWADSPKQKKLNQNFRSLDKRTRFRSLDFYDKIAFFSPYSVFFDQLTFDTARFLSNDHLP